MPSIKSGHCGFCHAAVPYEEEETHRCKGQLCRVNLWGGPGIGKSTTAARLFGELKVAGYSVEFIQEYIKAWAYEKRQLGSFDQVYIFAKQQRLEDRVLRAMVRLTVTDSPLLMQCVYAKRYNSLGWEQLIQIGKLFDEKYPSVNFLLKRTNTSYQTEGRWQTEEEAKQIDVEIEQFMNDYGIPYEKIDNNAALIAERVKELTR
jgi:nicotinamide riboside kinase